MLSADAVRRWCWWHKWTSLICTLFLLMLCVTGLPLIFHDELETAFSRLETPADLPAETPHASLDKIVEAARAQRPGEVVHLVFSNKDEPEKIYVGLGKTPTTPLDQDTAVYLDSRTAKVLGTEKADEGGLVEWLYKLHVEMFAGLPGKLFLGVMAALFLVALISGVIIYAPFMRERSYGAVRRVRGARLKWLDLHNLLGITTALWLLVVGATGMINTWADLFLKLWQFGQLSEMTAAYRGQPPALPTASLDAAVATARKSEPDKEMSFIAFPGTAFSSPHHYVVFMRGNRPLTARLIKPVLIDARTGQFTDKRDMPWYVTALLVSQPLHFGDYGGLPLKIIWALLDGVAMVVLVSGIVLWWKRRRTPVEIDLQELNPAE